MNHPLTMENECKMRARDAMQTCNFTRFYPSRRLFLQKPESLN